MQLGLWLIYFATSLEHLLTNYTETFNNGQVQEAVEEGALPPLHQGNFHGIQKVC